MAALTHADHCSVSASHFEAARAIAGTSADWACVAYFYSAYHSMKAAFLNDPIFDDLTALKKLDPNLMPTDRRPESHQVRKGQVGFGVNALVHLLYPSMRRDYERLHQASIGVRYRRNAVYDIEEIERMATVIQDARTAGMLVASPL